MHDRDGSCVQSVHVKNRCAFLNHSSNSGEFMRLVEANPNIALWFSVRIYPLPALFCCLLPIHVSLFYTWCEGAQRCEQVSCRAICEG